MGYLLDIDIWQSGATRTMQDGIVVKGLAPEPLDPLRYHVNPQCDLNELEKGMPWRAVQDEFSKFCWIDHEGRVYQGANARMVFIASMMHAHMQKPILSEKPHVTCPDDTVDNDHRKEVVHHEEVPGEAKLNKQSGDKKTTFTIQATSMHSCDNQDCGCEYWVRVREVYKEIESLFLARYGDH